jgi:hypothetical protein
MSMSPAMLTALSSRNPLLVHLLRIELPGRTIRLVDGSGFVIWGAEVFRGEDADFGKIAGFGDFTEGEGTEPINRGAQISVMINMPRVSTYTYTRADLIGAAEIRPLTPRRERKNTIIPRYKSEVHGWEYVPAGEVTSEVYLTEDRNEPRSLEIEYVHVRKAKQAGQLAAYDLANLREGLTAKLPSKAHLMHIHPGDCITVDVAELGLANQKFLVRRAPTNHQAASVTLELRSESDGKHAWALGQAANPPPSPSLSAVDPKYVPPPAPEDWTVVPKPPGGGGVSQPIFVIDLPLETSDIVGVIIKHGPSAAGPWTDGYEGSPRTDGRYEVAGLTPGQTYCVSLQYVAKNGAKSEPGIKCGIVAGDLTAGNVIPTAPTIVAMQDAIDAAGTGLGSLNAAIYTPGTGLLARSDAMFATLNTPTTGVLARLTAAETAITTNDAASSSRLLALEATVNTAGTGLVARMGVQETATANLALNKADATRVTALEATVNTSGTGLIAKVGALETATADLQSQKADATRVEVLEATAIGVRPTTITDVAGAFFTQAGPGTAPLGAANVGLDASGYYFKSSNAGAWIARGLVPIASDQVITVTGIWDQEVAGDNARITAWTFNAAGTMTAVSGPLAMFPVGVGNRITRSFGLAGSGAETTLPAGTVAARFGLQPNRTSAGSVRGRSLSIADGTLASTLNARVGTLETATTNLQTGKADASRVTSLEATVNTPGTGVTARLTTVESVAASANGTAKAIKGVVLDVNGYVSGFGSTNDGVTSSFEILAAAFGIRDPGSGERTEYRAGNWYVYSPTENTRARYGKAFGGTQKLVWWIGPASVAEGSETKANAYVYMSQNTVSGPRFGGSDVPINGFHAQADFAVRVGSRTSAGLVTTSTVTISVTGNTGPVTYAWTQIGGNEDWTITTASGAATAFRVNVSTPGEQKRAQFACVVTDTGSGRSFTIIVGAAALYNV